MAACPSCGHENPDGAKFCRSAPRRLYALPSVAEERKVVSVLFCDLVGFTAVSEQADPEDVDKMLAAYAEMARVWIEAHGGVVEKFIGDAVVGVFGVPAAHEDDPERAVRAGLRIVEGAEELEAIGGEPLRLRVGVNTGEALVRLGANAGWGSVCCRGTRSIRLRGCSRSRRRWVSRLGFRPSRRPLRCSTTRSSSPRR